MSRLTMRVAQVLALLCLASLIGCTPKDPSSSGPTKKSDHPLNENDARPRAELVEVTNNGIKGTYDQDSLRWMGDQLVIDLVLENPSNHDLHDLDVSISINERREDRYVFGGLKKTVQLANWRKGEKHRVVVPIVNNDLNSSSFPKKIEPSQDRDIKGTAVFRKLTGSDSHDYKVEFWGRIDGDDAVPRTASSGLGSVGQPPQTVTLSVGDRISYQMYLNPTFSADGNGATTLILQRFEQGAAKLPSLEKVKLLVVGYVGDVEQYRIPLVADSWPVGGVLSISIGSIEVTRLKIRGVGRRHASNADDVVQPQQVFYICEEFGISWKKK